MVGVGFTFVIPGCLPDIHWPLHIAVYTGSVNTNRVAFSHYYRFFKTRTHEKRLGDDFPEMVQKSVEVGLAWTGATSAETYRVKRATISGGSYTVIAPAVT